MSNLKKYLKRRSYKERAQPSDRKKLGLLEKHKDYVERAKNYHKQAAELERLQREAEERNPDEFYFSMEHERTRAGVPILFEKKRSTEEEMLLKSKDLNFINFRIRQEMKKMESLKASLHLLGYKAENKHVVFVDSPAEAENFSEEKFFDTPKELLDRRFNRPRKRQLNDDTIVQTSEEVVDEMRLEREQAERYKELDTCLANIQSLRSLAEEIRLKREIAKGEEHKKETLSDGTKVVKWKRIRK